MNAQAFLPRIVKAPIRPLRRGIRVRTVSFWAAVRAAGYRNPNRWWLRLLGSRVRKYYRLDVPPRGSRRIEIGPGWRPRPGYIHVDVEAASPGLHLLREGHRLPLPDGWADEVLAVHMIEHVPPARLKEMLREWHRVLRDGGELEIHTPDGKAIGRALLHAASANGDTFWALQDALFGYGWAPAEVHSPEQLGERGDHRTVFVFPALATLLKQAGFSKLRNVSGKAPCHHLLDWASYIPGFCLEVRARKSPSSSTRDGA